MSPLKYVIGAIPKGAKMKTRPVCLFIMDGYAFGKKNEGNAIELANVGVINSLMEKYPSTTIL